LEIVSVACSRDALFYFILFFGKLILDRNGILLLRWICEFWLI